MASLFEPLTIGGTTLRNRIAMSPMCQYSAGADASANEWHVVHIGARAVGGVGLVFTEATAVESRGRISQADLGIYCDEHVPSLARVVEFCHQHDACVGIQLAHAGRKAWSHNQAQGPEPTVAPSAIPFDEGWAIPHELSHSEIAAVVESFRQGSYRALQAGFDVIEIHGAHGYLINQFLSPLSNHRADGYGGPVENRARLLREVIQAVRSVWKDDRPLFLRISATDWLPGGNTIEDMVLVAAIASEAGVDLVDCSSGGILPAGPTPLDTTLYQTPFAERIRRDANIKTGAVGAITAAMQADEIIRNSRADLVFLARELLRDPYWPLHAAAELGQDFEWPRQYTSAKR